MKDIVGNYMKLTQKQKNDLKTVEYFTPFKDKTITEKDIEMFFEISEKGMHKDLFSSLEGTRKCTDGLWSLVEGKRWRGIHMQMYEEGVLDCSMPYCVILGGYKGDKPMPREVVDFMKKEMFKGIDSDIIERTYQEILNEKTI